MRKVELPSGATLTVNEAPFLQANSLYKAFCATLNNVKYDPEQASLELFKNLVTGAITSPSFEKALWDCLERCTYKKQGEEKELKVLPSTFDPSDARQDYMHCVVECTRENLLPFGKALMNVWNNLSAIIGSIPKP